jgi:hypothetical protein
MFATLCLRNICPKIIVLQVTFENSGAKQQPGLIVMHLTSEEEGEHAVHCEKYKHVVVVLNARPGAVAVPFPRSTSNLAIHPTFAALEHVKGCSVLAGGQSLQLPGRTMCVFVEMQPDHTTS